MNRLGMTAWEWVFFLVVITILVALWLSNQLEGSRRHPIGRTKSDMRSIETALEAYSVDEGRFPLSIGNPPVFANITTPVAYLTSYPMDPFLQHQRSFCYYTDPKGMGCIVWVSGPDRDLDLTLSLVEKIYKPGMDMQAPELINFSFDPTNGTASSGDIFRVMNAEQRITSDTLGR